MMEFVCLLVGLLMGGCITTVFLCSMQISRISSCEREIHKLRQQLKN